MRADILVLGAGPYGLALASELHRLGVECAVVGRPFATWHHHTLPCMRLRSDVRASSVHSPDGRYDFAAWLQRDDEAPAGSRPGIDVFRRYLSDVEQRLPFPVDRTEVASLERHGDRFVAATADGGSTWSAPRVVLATGVGAHRYVPPALAALGPDRVLHSWLAERITALSGRRVLVVGGGQSAAETVEQLMVTNRVTWAMRRRPLFFREPLRAPTPLFKLLLAGSDLLYRLPPSVLRPLAEMLFRTTITPELRAVYRDPRIDKTLADAAELGLRRSPTGLRSEALGEEFDRVVAATGYRPTVGALGFLSPELAAALGPADRPPELDRRFESRVEGLFLLGAIAERVAGPAARFIIGSRACARRLAPYLSDRVGAGDRKPARARLRAG